MGAIQASMSELDTLIQLLAKLPGLGPRSARRAALFLIKRREQIMEPLAGALAAAAAAVRPCSTCGNLDTADPCAICRDPERDATATAFGVRADGVLGPALTYRMMRPDGTDVALVDEAQAIRDHDGTLYRITGIVRVGEAKQ